MYFCSVYIQQHIQFYLTTIPYINQCIQGHLLELAFQICLLDQFGGLLLMLLLKDLFTFNQLFTLSLLINNCLHAKVGLLENTGTQIKQHISHLFLLENVIQFLGIVNDQRWCFIAHFTRLGPLAHYISQYIFHLQIYAQ